MTHHLFRSSDDWLTDAATVIADGDRAVLPHLVAAYDSPVEGNRQPLLGAMEAIGAVREATELAASADPQARRLAARLMHLLPDQTHLPALEPLVTDPDPTVAAAARRAMRGQPRTPAWHRAATRLSRSDDEDTRDAALRWLAESGSSQIRWEGDDAPGGGGSLVR